MTHVAIDHLGRVMTPDWRHQLCTPCWHQREPDRTPVRVLGAPAALCCLCGKPTDGAGIYLFIEPTDPCLRHCKGQHQAAEGSR